eukprot:5934994-Ditylum_brightwellii.AAC.1
MSISVLARSYEQVDAICQIIEQGHMDDNRGRFDEMIVDFLEIEGMKEAVNRIRNCGKIAAKNGREVRIVVASPRIIKPGESGIWRTLLRLEPDGLLVRSA